MELSLPGFVYKQYEDSITGKEMEKVYDVTIDIDPDSIESMCPSCGPYDMPQRLQFTRITCKSGRQHDINMSMQDVRTKLFNARRVAHIYKLLVQSN